jgi:hypothetical protein
MDLGDSLGRAFQAARRGDLETLEIELVRLRSLPEESIIGIDARLRAIARAARSHPSYNRQPRAEAV